MLAPPKSASEGALLGQARPLAIARWLWAVAWLVVLMVVVGGITRLTESGLSITEWKPITGALPPFTDAHWQREFDLYRQTTQYEVVNRGMSLAEFKFIYFWEWAHRQLGRIIGLAFALPLAWFAWKRAIPAGFWPRLLLLLGLGGLQGFVGWWMVVSGLAGQVDVSHYRLAVHLSLALLILALLVWTARDMRLLAGAPVAPRRRLTKGAAIVLGVLSLQILWGAFTAGLKAGYAFSSWPLMGGELFPAATPMPAPWILNLADNPVVVQFIHRWWAFVAAGALIWLGIRAMRAGERGVGAALHALVVIQLLLGIATLMTGVELWVAVAHQGVAALVVIAATLSAHAVAAPARPAA